MEKEKVLSRRKDKRQFYRILLPTDLLLQFQVKLENSDPAWNFGGQLIHRRNSLVKEDQLFFEALKKIKNNFPDSLAAKDKFLDVKSQIYEELTFLSLIYRALDEIS